MMIVRQTIGSSIPNNLLTTGPVVVTVVMASGYDLMRKQSSRGEPPSVVRVERRWTSGTLHDFNGIKHLDIPIE